MPLDDTESETEDENEIQHPRVQAVATAVPSPAGASRVVGRVKKKPNVAFILGGINHIAQSQESQPSVLALGGSAGGQCNAGAYALRGTADAQAARRSAVHCGEDEKKRRDWRRGKAHRSDRKATGYNIYSKKVREQVKAQHPEEAANAYQIIAITRRWYQALSDCERAHYEKEAATIEEAKQAKLEAASNSGPALLLPAHDQLLHKKAREMSLSADNASAHISTTPPKTAPPPVNLEGVGKGAEAYDGDRVGEVGRKSGECVGASTSATTSIARSAPDDMHLHKHPSPSMHDVEEEDENVPKRARPAKICQELLDADTKRAKTECAYNALGVGITGERDTHEQQPVRAVARGYVPPSEADHDDNTSVVLVTAVLVEEGAGVKGGSAGGAGGVGGGGSGGCGWVAIGWHDKYNQMKAYYEAHGHTHVAFKDNQLGPWAHKQRVKYRSGSMSAEKLALLREIDFCFDGKQAQALRGGLESAKFGVTELQYKKEHLLPEVGEHQLQQQQQDYVVVSTAAEERGTDRPLCAFSGSCPGIGGKTRSCTQCNTAAGTSTIMMSSSDDKEEEEIIIHTQHDMSNPKSINNLVQDNTCTSTSTSTYEKEIIHTDSSSSRTWDEGVGNKAGGTFAELGVGSAKRSGACHSVSTVASCDTSAASASGDPLVEPMC